MRDEGVGDHHSHSTEEEPAPQHHGSPKSNTEPPNIQQQQQRPWFAWGSATSFSPFELAEDTMEEAVGILKDVVAVMDQFWMPPVAVRTVMRQAIQKLKTALAAT